jgi:Holliday junction resolvase
MPTPESKVKAAVVKLLKKHGIYYFFPATHGYGRSGVPDIVCCFDGKFLAFECKAGDNKPTALQEKEMNKIFESGGSAYVINEDNVNEVEELIILKRRNAGAVKDIITKHKELSAKMDAFRKRSDNQKDDDRC